MSKLKTKKLGSSVNKSNPIVSSGLRTVESSGSSVETKNKTDGGVVSNPRSSGFGDLRKALEKARGKKLLICIKGYPDPDNIGSALALEWLAQNFEISTKIIYFDKISHHENRALVKKLDIDLEHVDLEQSAGSQFDASMFDYFAVNDSQTIHLPISLPKKCELLVFVDHHKPLGNISGLFIDVRESAGSTSAIYAEYIQESALNFSGEQQEHSRVATALMHGIRSDTDNYVLAAAIDYKASQFLAPILDKDMLSLISKQAISAKTMDLTQIALQHKEIRETYLFSGVGYVREEERDGIGQAADYLLNREGIETVVVYGIVGEYVDGSLRTRSHTLDPDKWIKDVFGKEESGKWYGGGRKDKGGFKISLGALSKCRDRELLWILTKKTIDELLYEKIGVGSDLSRDSDLVSGKV